MIDLKNQIAIITGASGGIGQAIAVKLAGKNTGLCLVGRDIEKLERQKQLLLKKTSNVHIFSADFTVKKDIEKLTTRIIKQFGKVDILIHNAGFLSMGAIETTSIDDLALHYKINFLAPYMMTKALLPSLKMTKGQIVFLITSATQRPIPQLAQYSSTKTALKGFADTLREEINQHGIRVTNIFPGQTATPMQEAIYSAKGAQYKPEKMLQPEDIADVVVHALMLSKTAEITDIYIRPMQKSG